MPKKIKTETFEITDYSPEILALLEAKKDVILEELGWTAESFAKAEINERLYSTPPSPNYVRTGRLRNSIAHATAKDAGKVIEYEFKVTNKDGSKTAEKGSYKIKNGGADNAVYVGTSVEYAPYVEFGARGRKGVHFLEHALKDHVDDYRKLIEKHLQGI